MMFYFGRYLFTSDWSLSKKELLTSIIDNRYEMVMVWSDHNPWKICMACTGAVWIYRHLAIYLAHIRPYNVTWTSDLTFVLRVSNVQNVIQSTSVGRSSERSLHVHLPSTWHPKVRSVNVIRTSSANVQTKSYGC